MERDDDFGEDHGPERFSLLYVRGEGVATFAGLYAANKVSPKALAIIQPGQVLRPVSTNSLNPTLMECRPMYSMVASDAIMMT